LTIKKGLKSFIATAFVACLALPGIASATILTLDLSNSGPLGSSQYNSGDIFSSAQLGLGLGFVLQVNASNGSDIRPGNVGTGVEGGASRTEIGEDEWIEFVFNPDALLAGFTITTGNGADIIYGINNSPVGFTHISGPDDPFVFASVTATSLKIASTELLCGTACQSFRVGSLSFDDGVAAVSEPAVLGLLGFGLMGMGGIRRMKKAV